MAFRLLSKLRTYSNLSLRTQQFHVSACCSKLVQFLLSDIGEGIREVTVKDWFVKEGDKVTQFQDVCLVESDKASVNITSRYDGIVKKIHYSVGDVALVGKALLDIETDEGEPEAPVQTAPVEEPARAPLDRDISSQKSEGKVLAVPAVRRIAAENNVNLKYVKATGKGGRVTKEDILKYLGGHTVQKEEQPVVPTHSDRIVPITGITKVMVATMTKSNSIPTFTIMEEVNATALLQFRESYNSKSEEKISLVAFFIKALSKSIEKFPMLNAHTDENCENVIYKAEHNIGFAVDSKVGLLVPNLKGVEKKSIAQLGTELQRLLESAKEGLVNPADLTGGTIAVSNIGNIGGMFATPLIIPPQVAIVGIGRIQRKPIFDAKGQVTSADVLFTSWSGDHRVIDGATMARFSQLWKHYIENPTILALA